MYEQKNVYGINVVKNRGFVIVAQNTNSVDYVKCARALAKSIKKHMPKESVTLVTDNKVKKTKEFDHIVKFPYGDQAPDSEWKLANDWQVYEASPYKHTIKLEADMYLPYKIDYWWEVLKDRSLVVSTCIRDYKQNISDIRAYRQFIDDNGLPDCYNSITYFKKSPLASKFYLIVKDIFSNWTAYKSILKCNPNEICTTDWAYAIASHIIGPEHTTMPSFTGMSMVHMKQFINNLPSENWTDTLVYEVLPNTLRINTYPQRYPFHYQVKSFADKLL